MNTPKQAIIQKKVRMEDFICLRCHSESANTADQICQLCKAIGKSAEPPETEFSFREFFGMKRVKPLLNQA